MSVTTITAHERVSEVVEEILAGSPDYLVELEVRGSRGSQTVDVFIDSDGGLPVERLATISREVSFILETENILPSSFRLNVSSPGLDRPLRLLRQYKKNIGRMLRVHFRKSSDGGFTEVLGTLEDADEECIVITSPRAEGKRITYPDILWAKVQLPW